MSALINYSISKTAEQQRGFTLLELVLVMLIIGLVASTPLVFIDNQDNQFRYEETLEKLKLIENAVFLPQSYRGEPVLSGFVVDNGVLPSIPASAALQPLISKDDFWNKSGANDWAEFDGYDPHIKIAPFSSASITGYKQTKGYRGNYLSEGLDSSGRFLDSWGEEFAVTSASGDYMAEYQGNDSSHPSPAAYSTAISRSVNSDRWSVPLNQIDIKVTNNNTGADRTAGLVVFKNTATSTEADRWTTYHFSVPAASGATPTIKHSLSENWFQNGILMTSASVAAATIPAGLHPVFVVEELDPDDVEGYDRLLVIPGATQPSLQFEVD